MKKIIQLFEQTFGYPPTQITPLPISGSNRKYIRLQSPTQCAVGVIGTSVEENRAFCALDVHFLSKGIAVPKLYAHSSDYKYYLLEDLGDDTLFAHISACQQSGKWSVETIDLLEKTMAEIPKIQFEVGQDFDFSVCYPQSTFDRRTVLWDLNYFKYNFLKTLDLDFREDLLENDFEAFSHSLLKTGNGNTFLYRDFQSRNVMIKDNKPFFIDFQGGRRGPIYYDVASFLWQAKANFSDHLRERLLQIYFKKLQEYITIDEIEFRDNLYLFVLFRTLQVLGAYGFRGYFERKSHFLQSIPYAVENLKQLLPIIESSQIPYLYSLLDQMVNLRCLNIKESQFDGLTIKIYSFSYLKGVPMDMSGNGGGYVFDCRAIHNPGRYEAYKQLTGIDEEVISFLERGGEMAQFLKSVYQLADEHVECYIKRSFKHLMFAFGCTGGQHRSVYAAQHLSEYLAKKYPVRVELCHREQNKNFIFERGELLKETTI